MPRCNTVCSSPNSVNPGILAKHNTQDNESYIPLEFELLGKLPGVVSKAEHTKFLGTCRLQATSLTFAVGNAEDLSRLLENNFHVNSHSMALIHLYYSKKSFKELIPSFKPGVVVAHTGLGG
jgi:hypothetical protein